MRPTYRPRSSAPLDYRMDLPSLPYLPLRQLFEMLPIQSKRRLRLVSNSFRDMIDVIYGMKFLVTLSDKTLAHVFKFNRFDLDFGPRNLYRLDVTKLLTPFTLPSTSLSRCPLPRPIHTLTFTKILGVSERNFVKLLTFYGATNSLRKLVVNIDCLESKITSTKALKKVNMNSIQELELQFSHKPLCSRQLRYENKLDMILAVTNEKYPTLQTFKIDLEVGIHLPHVLYQQLNVFISRHLKHLINVEFIQPRLYREARFLPPHVNLFPLGPLRVNLLKEFEQESKLRELRLTLSFHEYANVDTLPNSPWGLDDLGMTLVNYQKHLVVLELSHIALTTGAPDLSTVLQNCGNTLITVRVDTYSYEIIPRDVWFNLGWLQPCKVLKTFELTNDCYAYDAQQAAQRSVSFLNTDDLPVSLEHLVLPNRLETADIEMMRGSLTKLQSLGFGHQIVTLEQIQMLLGNEGIPTLRKITLKDRDFCEFEAISDWVGGLGEDAAANKRVTISEVVCPKIRSDANRNQTFKNSKYVMLEKK